MGAARRCQGLAAESPCRAIGEPALRLCRTRRPGSAPSTSRLGQVAAAVLAGAYLAPRVGRNQGQRAAPGQPSVALVGHEGRQAGPGRPAVPRRGFFFVIPLAHRRPLTPRRPHSVGNPGYVTMAAIRATRWPVPFWGRNWAGFRMCHRIARHAGASRSSLETPGFRLAPGMMANIKPPDWNATDCSDGGVDSPAGRG